MHGATSLIGNRSLIDYGIQNENSHIRAHVCPIVRRVYVYPTACGMATIGSGDYPKVGGHQPGVNFITSEGYLVPPFDIQRCAAISINDGVWDALAFAETDSTSVKGRKAVRLVVGMLKHGLFPFPALAEEITDEDLQISGADILIKAGVVAKEGTIIQVKCDLKGGEAELGGTGNLFLQVSECNPFSNH